MSHVYRVPVWEAGQSKKMGLPNGIAEKFRDFNDLHLVQDAVPDLVRTCMCE